MPRMVQLPMFQHAFEIDSTPSPSVRKGDDFDFVKEAFENEFISGSSSRGASSYGDRMERHTSGTTAEISEITPISEDSQSSTDSDEIDSHEGWTTVSSEEWYNEEDGVSLPSQPT